MSISFSSKISSLRREKNITQKAAADALGISQALLSHYEKGIRECNLDFVVKTAVFYDVTADYLLGLSENKHGSTDMFDLTEIQSDNQVKTKTLLRTFMYLLKTAVDENELTELFFNDYFSLSIEKFLSLTKNSDPKLNRLCDIAIDGIKVPKLKIQTDSDDNLPLYLKTVDEHAKKLISEEVNKIIK